MYIMTRGRRTKFTILDTYRTKNNEWYMDNDKAVGIQKLEYTDDPQLDKLRKFQFYIWAANFSEPNAPNGSLEITSNEQMRNIFQDRNIEHIVFLRGDLKEDPSLSDDWDCLFFQVEFQISFYSFESHQFEILRREAQKIIHRLHV